MSNTAGCVVMEVREKLCRLWPLQRFKTLIREGLPKLCSKLSLERLPCSKQLIVTEYEPKVGLGELYHDGMEILLHEAHAHGDPALEGQGEEKGSRRLIAPRKLLIPLCQLLFKIRLCVVPVPERIDVHEVEKE